MRSERLEVSILGQTIRNLATRKLKDNKIFANRFVIELCECMHFHYRTLDSILVAKTGTELRQDVQIV